MMRGMCCTARLSIIPNPMPCEGKAPTKDTNMYAQSMTSPTQGHQCLRPCLFSVALSCIGKTLLSNCDEQTCLSALVRQARSWRPSRAVAMELHHHTCTDQEKKRVTQLFWLLVDVQIGSSMDEAEFAQRVVPCVSKLFTSTDRSIRRSLLENIDAYGKQLSQARPFHKAHHSTMQGPDRGMGHSYGLVDQCVSSFLEFQYAEPALHCHTGLVVYFGLHHAQCCMLGLAHVSSPCTHQNSRVLRCRG